MSAKSARVSTLILGLYVHIQLEHAISLEDELMNECLYPRNCMLLFLPGFRSGLSFPYAAVMSDFMGHMLVVAYCTQGKVQDEPSSRCISFLYLQ